MIQALGYAPVAGGGLPVELIPGQTAKPRPHALRDVFQPAHQCIDPIVHNVTAMAGFAR